MTQPPDPHDARLTADQPPGQTSCGAHLPVAIENHGVIGDMHTVALVSLDASIDFMCLPRFDSPSVFAALLDPVRGGFFQLAPELQQARHTQMYLPETNVLLTKFLAEGGMAEVSDFMAVLERGAAGEYSPAHPLVRRAKCIRGELRFRMRCAPRFDYARASHDTRLDGGGVVHFTSRGPDGLGLLLRCQVPCRVVDGDAVAEFTLREGQSAWFVLECIQAGGESPSAAPSFVTEAFKETSNFWRKWVGRSTYRGRWREIVNRSALTLKLLTSRQYGSLIAAPTFGLPEALGGGRNWDYRYTWIRDASFTLYALSRLGYTEEAGAFMKWVEARCRDLNPDGSLDLVYRIDGRRDLDEVVLPHLEGYHHSRPVRIGNQAHDQLQLDIYGELMDAVYIYDKYGEPISHDLWCNLRRLLDWVAANYRQPDEGIWEMRSGRQHFLFSRLMCWVAMDRGIRLSTRRSLPAPVDRWLAVRDAIHEEIHSDFFDPQLGAFTQVAGQPILDSSVLLMPLVRFISPTDPRWLSTLRTFAKRLSLDSLLWRYKVEPGASLDGLDDSDGTFNLCSFWFVECLSRAGDINQARLYFEKMLGYANHLGLYAEELGPRGEHLGNFPQAFTHLALISAAYDLDRRLNAAGWRA